MRRKFFVVFVTYVVASFVSGCQMTADVTHHPRASSTTMKARIRTEHLADDRRGAGSSNKVGHHLLTVFGMPTLDVKSSAEVSEQVDKAVRETLRSVGIEPVPKESGSGPILRGRLLRLHFWNYTWFYPVLIMGGSVELRLELVDEQGKAIWYKTFKRGSGFPNLLIGFGFKTMIQNAMNKVLDDIAQECETVQFKDALSKPAQLGDIGGLTVH